MNGRLAPAICGKICSKVRSCEVGESDQKSKLCSQDIFTAQKKITFFKNKKGMHQRCALITPVGTH